MLNVIQERTSNSQNNFYKLNEQKGIRKDGSLEICKTLTIKISKPITSLQIKKSNDKL